MLREGRGAARINFVARRLMTLERRTLSSSRSLANPNELDNLISSLLALCCLLGTKNAPVDRHLAQPSHSQLFFSLAHSLPSVTDDRSLYYTSTPLCRDTFRGSHRDCLPRHLFTQSAHLHIIYIFV